MTSPTQRELSKMIEALPGGGHLISRMPDTPAVHLVGGAVRDMLRGAQPAELDLVVEGEIGPVLARLGGSAVEHDRFGTATVTAEGFVYDVARSRRERYARPGALPDVEPAPLSEDLRRRDFTVNAMAVALSEGRRGELTSAPHALADLEAGLLRILHDDSFLDDPTRLLRLARYSARLGFEIAPKTAELAAHAISGGALSTVSTARIGSELRLAARERDAVAALAALRELQLDVAIDPAFGLRDEALARRALGLLPPDGHADRLALACASMAIAPGDLPALLDRMAFSAPDRDAIALAASRAEDLAAALRAAGRPSEIASAVVERGGDAELVALAGALGAAAAARQWFESLRQVRLEIDGNDLVAAGVPEGPLVGAGLKAAMAAKLDGVASGREAELRTALETIRGESR